MNKFKSLGIYYWNCLDSYLFQASEELLSKHYADLSSRPFFPGLVKYMSSGPVVPMVLHVQLLFQQ